jgi:uncharacterized protein (TIGR02147 family)
VATSTNIYAYQDFRLFLKDYLHEMKAKKPAISQRFLLARLGVTSSGFLANILSGKRNIPHQYVSKISDAIGLGRKAGRYFETLVLFTQARKQSDKARLFQELMSQKPADLKLLEGRELRLFSTWYYVALRELVFFFPMRDQYETLAKKLIPSIRQSEAKAAIEELLEMGLLERDRRGFLRQKQAALTSGDEVRSIHAAEYQKATLELAKGALERIPPSERDISTLTMTLSEASFKTAVEEIRQLRKRLLKMAVDEPQPDRVFQLNMQLFPITKKK